MDEQRVQAYLSLIQELFDGPSGEEPDILNRHMDLVDEGFVLVCELMAAQLQQAGQDNRAQFLRDWAQQVAAFLAQGETQGNATPEEYLQFLMEVLQAILHSDGNPAVVYPLFRQNLDKLDLNLAQILTAFARDIFDQIKVEEAADITVDDITVDIVSFAKLIAQFPLGGRADNLEIAIAAYKLALEVITREAFPEQWSMIQNNLGIAYRNRIRGEWADNLEDAIAAYKLALEVRTSEAFREDWAGTQNNLGNAYRNRIRGERADNLEIAIAAYQLALEVYTREAFPYEWAMTKNNLGSAYGERIKGERADNLEDAIAAYKLALEVITRQAFPEEWAMIQNNLGNTYINRIKGERADNLEDAIAASKLALEVTTREAFPEQWATIQNNLGNAYLDRIKGERADNLEKAIVAYQLALEVTTREAFPKDWAMTQNNLGNAYLDRIKGERADNLEKAIATYQLALEVTTREAFSYEWAMTQNNLGLAYSNRIKGEGADNLEMAIATYQLALEVRTREAFPEDWAGTQNNLGNAYRNRIKGERADNLEMAIAANQLALEVYTREAFPEYWAKTQINLGTAYYSRIKGERADNLEKAITANQLALEVYTREAFPQDHLVNLFNLGCAYQEQSQHYIHGPKKKQKALEHAYKTFDQALDTVEYLRGEIISGDEAKRKLNEEWTKLYLRMVKVCLELGRYNDAIEYVDRSKARNLTELIATNDIYPGGEIPAKVRQRLQELRQAISEEDRRLKQDPNPDYTHITQLRDEFQAKYPYKPLKFSDMQSLLDDETVILEWYILDQKFLTFTLTNQTLNLWTSSEEDRQNLTDWAVAYINDYINNNSQWRDSLSQRLETLAQILHLDEILANLRQNFPNCQKLILIPHRYLHLFPIHALPISLPSPAGRGAGGEGKFLQDLFPKGVGYAPNCQVLQQAQKRSRPDFNRLFAIQNPTQDLGWADVEIENIRTLFPDRKTLAGNNATKANLLDEQRQKILSQTHHLFFSCHAAFNLTSPLDSGLLLADGILTLENIIANLNLSNCSLVTLSACETGQVAIDQSDEYISLSSGFILAGSPSVLVSLWSVNQVSTALLLIRTYELLQQQPGQLALSLQAAQKWLRETTVSGFEQWRQQCPLFSEEWRETLQPVFAQMGQNKEEGINHRPYQSPYHWAAFCIVGQGEQNMVTDAKKIAAFTALLQENLNNWIANHGESLLALQQQLDDDDEKNAQAIESWLKEREDLYKQYEAKLASPKRSLSLSGEKGFPGTKPRGNDKSLEQLIEQAVKGIKPPGNDKSLDELIKQELKPNTNLKTSAPSPEQDREKPLS